MISLSRVDKKKKSVIDNNSNKNKNVSPNILGRPTQVKSMCGKHCYMLLYIYYLKRIKMTKQIY